MRANIILRQHHRRAILWVRATVARSHGGVSSHVLRIPHDDNGGPHVCLQRRRHYSVLAPKQQEGDSKGAVVPVSDNSDLPSTPIDFELSSRIEGEESHIATIELRPGEKLRAESGSMLYMTDGVEMETTMQGMSSAFSRMMTGQNLFFTDFVYSKESGSGTVCLGTDFPSKILRFNLNEMPDSTLICQKGAYLASNPNVNIEMEFTRSFTAGFFGGEGFVLQKLSGGGDVLVKGGGTIVKKTLREGEVLRVTSGSLVAFEATVSYDVQMVQGIRNAMFGGEGLFITSLTGPGSVWLQGMPPDRMIAEIARRVPSGSGIGLGVPIGFGGAGDGAAGGTDAAAAGAADELGASAATSGSSSSTSAAVAGEEAIEADRNTTVATSGIDSESPSALFGDAAPNDLHASYDASPSNESQFSSENHDVFSTDLQDEQVFRDDTAFDNSSNTNVADGELFDDNPEAAGPNIDSVDDGDSSGGLFQTLWDIFSGGDGD